MPNFEVLDARMASALNKIIHNSQFIRRISLEEQKAQKEDRFLRGRQIACLIYEYFRVTGANDSVENYADLFRFKVRRNSIVSNIGTGGIEVCVVLFNPRIHLFECTHPSVSNTFGLWFLVCVQASVYSPLFKHVWIVVPCLCTSISLQPCVSNTFRLWLLVYYLVWMMWHWYARKKSSWTKHSLIRQKLGVYRAIPWQRKCASKKFGPCAGRRLQRGHGQPASKTEQEDQVLSDEVKRSLDGQWEACHGFVLNTFRLLSETQQNKIYRMSHGAPRAFPTVLLESMHLLCRFFGR